MTPSRRPDSKIDRMPHGGTAGRRGDIFFQDFKKKIHNLLTVLEFIIYNKSIQKTNSQPNPAKSQTSQCGTFRASAVAMLLERRNQIFLGLISQAVSVKNWQR
jgi:hypothetical protein